MTEGMAEMDEHPYFARVDDSAFWGDRERVRTMIELYEKNSCLWNVKSTEYKNITKKKAAKVEIGKHFGYSGKQARIFIMGRSLFSIVAVFIFANA